MPRDHVGARPGFRIFSQSVYANLGLPTGHLDEINVGFYDDDGNKIGGGGTSGEFCFVWTQLTKTRTAIHLRCYSDGWSALCRIPHLLNLMNSLDTTNQTALTVNQFSDHLKSIGIMDMTNRAKND